MLSINIQMHSFVFNKELVSPKDKVRVSITTLPEGQKQAQTIDIKKLDMMKPSFNIKFNENTDKIVVVFRRKSILACDPIIASTVMKTRDLNIFDNKMNEKKNVRIFEPISQAKDKRKILGRMTIEFALEETNANKNNKIIKEKIKEHKGQEYSKINPYFNNDNIKPLFDEDSFELIN